MARIHELVKTYKLLNDPNSPNWSIRFVGAIAAVTLLVAGAGAVVWATGGHAGGIPNQIAASSSSASDGTKTDSIYFNNFDAALGPDHAKLDEAMAKWQAEHKGATILSQQPMYDATRVYVIGYAIHYR